jgi:hypothetical protein
MPAGCGPPGQSLRPAQTQHDIRKYGYRCCGWLPARQDAIPMVVQDLKVDAEVLPIFHETGLRHSLTWVKLSGAATSR